MSNPYQYESPTTETGRFAGRAEAFAFIQSHLVGGPQTRALSILGPPKIGKSSLLRHLPRHLDSRYCPIRLSLRVSSVAGESAWLHTLAGAVPDVLADLDIQSARLPELPGQPADLRDALLGEYMAEGLRSMRRDRHLLLLVDNADRLLTAVQQHSLPRDSFAFLGEMLAAHSHLDMIMAFDSRHESDLLTVGAPFDPALMYRLGPFPREEMESLLCLPPEEGGLVFEPFTLDRIHDLSNGHPYLVQLLGWLIYERMSEQKRLDAPVTLEDVEAVTPAALVMAGDTLGAVWQHGSPHDRLVLAALSALAPEEPPQPVPHEDVGAWLIAADRELDPRTVNATWRRLEYENVLRLQADGRLLINGGLQRRWLREHITLPKGPGQGRGMRWRQIVIVLLAVLIGLALLVGLLATRPEAVPGTVAPDVEPTITLGSELQATGEAYDATQAAAP